MNPIQIVTRPAFTAIGLLYRGDNKNNEIPQLWDAFSPDKALEITNKINPFIAYGVEDNFDHDAGVWNYVAGYEVEADAPVPPGMAKKHIPEQTYAVFQTVLPEIGKTMDAIYQTWLPESEYRRADGPEFELYNEEFNPPMGLLTMYVYIPIVEK
jgi:AraC family transcriptional regulator